MELRHLRYFVAVADAGSLTVAAARKLHTSQPSLSRQIRDLEDEVGAQLLTRSAHGIELTPAGRAFLDHARLVLSHAEAAAGAARRIANPAKPCFVIGFLTGHELTWMPEALQILRDELPNIDVMISSQYSPQLADAFNVPLAELLAASERLNAAGIQTQNFAGEKTTEPSVIGWKPSAQLYFRDRDGHSVEFITLLDESPEPEFVGSALRMEKAQSRCVIVPI